MSDQPLELTSFVGRQDELSEIERLLTHRRLLTMIGPGGVGKTRIAMQVIQTVADRFPDGSIFVRLDSLTEPALLADTVANALGLQNLPQDPITKTVNFLRNKKFLLILDNCEHIVEACAHFAVRLLRASPELRILATSRQVLDVEGEQLYEVRPLPIERGDQTTPAARGLGGDAVTLFADRAAAAVPGFSLDAHNVETVVQICRRLNGVPLTIELAAVRLRILSLDELLDHLEDRFAVLNRGSRTKSARQRTLAATVGWSYDLCSEAERTLWRQLSIFPGGFTRAAAEAVCDPGGRNSYELINLIDSLRDKSILHRDSDSPVARYSMLDTLRQYGLEKLPDDDRVTLERRHRDYLIRMTSAVMSSWFGPDQLELATMVDDEQANLRAGLSFSLSRAEDHEAGAQLAVNLVYYWLHCGFLSECRIWLNRILQNATLPARLHISALWIYAWATIVLGHIDTGREMAIRAFEMAQEEQDLHLKGETAAVMGGLKLIEADLDDADAYYSKSIEYFERIGQPDCYLVHSYAIRGMIGAFSGNLDTAERMARTAFSMAEQHLEQWSRAYASHALALIEWQRGNTAEALRHINDSLRVKALFKDILGQSMDVELYAWIVVDSNPKLAATLLGVSQGMWNRIGGELLLGSKTWLDRHHDCEERIRRSLDEQSIATAFAEGTKLGKDLRQAVRTILALELEQAPLSPAQPGGLTRRELEIAELVASGKSNKEIAKQLTISHRTVEVHVEHILEKLQFTSRTQVAMWVAEHKDVRDREKSRTHRGPQ